MIEVTIRRPFSLHSVYDVAEDRLLNFPSPSNYYSLVASPLYFLLCHHSPFSSFSLLVVPWVSFLVFGHPCKWRIVATVLKFLPQHSRRFLLLIVLVGLNPEQSVLVRCLSLPTLRVQYNRKKPSVSAEDVTPKKINREFNICKLYWSNKMELLLYF
jgi:hypothetical protein